MTPTVADCGRPTGDPVDCEHHGSGAITRRTPSTEGLVDTGGVLLIAGLNCLPLAALAALAKLMHCSVVVLVLLAAVGALI